MLRISAGVSLCFTVLAIGGAVGGCSSESTDGGGKAGSGSSSTAGSNNSSGSGSGGTKSDGAGGTGNNSGGTSTGTGGGRAGSTSTAGNSGSCTPGQVTCVDEETAATCDADTGETVTVNCVEELKDIGITSTGCVGDAREGNCDGEPSDAECFDGATVFAICGQFTQEQFLNTYINCFQNNNDLQVPIRCVGPYLAPSGTEADCDAAAAECLEGLAGAGAGGAGG